MKQENWRVRMGWFLGIVLVMGCAQVSSPAGGPLDEIAPQVLEMTPPNGSSDLQLESLTLRFDEYVVSRNAVSQMLISPPITGTPQFKTKGKEVHVLFESDWFEAETTYVLNFGDALVDLHESNPAEALFFAFSTGSELDTLTLNGQVVDQLSGGGVGGLRTLFFKDSTPWDSIWGGERPVAVAITDEEGFFQGSFLAAGLYKALAVDDVNRDYRWNPGESLAFSNVSVAAGERWAAPWLFAPTAPPMSSAYIASASVDSSGFMRVLAPKNEEDMEEEWSVLMDDKALDILWFRTGDSVKLWTPKPQFLESPLAVWTWTDGADSLQARLTRSRMGSALNMTPQWPAKTDVRSERTWEFGRVLRSVDPALWSLRVDTINLPLLPGDVTLSESSTGGHSVEIRIEEISGQKYQLTILPGGVTSREGASVQDTLMWKWQTWPEDHFGSFTLDVSDLPGPGWLQCSPKGKPTAELSRIRCESDTIVGWPKLHPGQYEVGFELDANNDSIWQAMDPLRQQTPEAYFYLSKALDVRSNWEMEWTWSLKREGEELEQ
tara:strand:- start:2472 stop:4121 length:1650 start_codon:yes stop_codon:yes gene_type:complete